MPEHGDDERPRPPRRVPPGAGGTVIEAPAEHRVAQAPVRRPPRAWYLLPLVLALIGAGAGTGWLVREQQKAGPDTPTATPSQTADLLLTVRPSVVQVLATTCDGTGHAAGIVLADNLVLTAAAAVRGHVSIAVRLNDGSPDGTVRTAQVRGSSADGLALLRVTGGLGGKPATLAPAGAGPGGSPSLVRYDGLGRQVLERLTGDPIDPQLHQIAEPGPLGSPVLDSQARVTGLVTGNGTSDARQIPADALRTYLGAQPPITPVPAGECETPSGPRNQLTPALVTNPTQLAKDVQVILAAYINAVNKHEFIAARSLYSRALRNRDSLEDLITNQRTSYWFGARIVMVRAAGDGAVAVMRFTVVHAGDSGGPATGQSCTRWNLAYRLVREDGLLRIQTVNPANPEADEAYTPCDA